MKNILSPWKSLNKAFIRLNPSWQEITPFRHNLLNLLQNIQGGETEEFHKNLIRNFLQKTYYQNNYFINTKGLCDLVVHMEKNTNSPVGLMLNFKSPTNKGEMPKTDQLNVKGLQQLLFYFLAERINQKNFELKHLIVTNCYEWFVFDAQEFERLFIQNQALVKQFKNFGEDRLSGSRTKFFYENIAIPAIENILPELKFTYWDLRNYQAVIEKATPDQKLTDQEQQDLIALFKIFSPEHLLKLPFANDSNTLNQEFYNELLHIIGLTETKHGNKKLIERLPANERNPGSLLEGVIREIENLGKLSNLSNPEHYGNTAQEQLFNVALELVITWINRILFIKLLEAQLIRYHQSDSTFPFLNISKLENFSDLNQLFFSILARQIEDRPAYIKDKFNHVPYLNSSLFEPTDLEMNIIVIGNLNGTSLIFPQTILKDSQGNRLTGKLKTLQYLFEFLDAYDFGSNITFGIREKSKSLINAAVLGLIFEKINGYQDASFYTPGFITMYMCRETIQRAVVQKFNEVKGWNYTNFADLQEDLAKYIKKCSDHIIARNEANQIINSLKICDPAVGSGHFLVSALNEIIVVKHQLGILQDKNGKTLRQYEINVENDELIIYNIDGSLFEYNSRNKESERVQETIFHEKQTLIKNCLFGVDININSVKICQLRLWIELLKNAYYKADNQLETLPNIDINIKHGNSLISRFGIDADLKSILIARNNKSDIADYRHATHAYFQATSKEEKNQAKKTIAEIKQKIQNSLQSASHKRSKLKKLEQELCLENQPSLLEESKTKKKAKEKKIAKLNNEIDKLKVAIEEEESGLFYANALEWRFEFPEVLNDDGDFIGFDVIIGNPPYIQLSKTSFINNSYKKYLLNRYETSGGRLNTFIFFIHLSSKLLKTKGLSNYIIPNTILTQEYYLFTRKFLLDTVQLTEVVNFLHLPFEDAVVETVIIQFINNRNSVDYLVSVKKIVLNDYQIKSQIKVSEIKSNHNYSLIFANDNIVTKVFNYDNLILGDICDVNQGIALKGDKSLSLKSDNKKGEYKKLLDGRNIKKYSILWDDFYLDYNVSRIHSCKRQDIFEALEKLLFRRVSKKLIFTYDNSKYYALNTLIIVNLKGNGSNFNLKFILGLMNSKLMNYIYIKKFKSTKTVFSEIQTRSVCQLPVPKIDINLQSNFVRLVDEILKEKQFNPDANTSKLEKEIDCLVYELYGLTIEEISMVENYDN